MNGLDFVFGIFIGITLTFFGMFIFKMLKEQREDWKRQFKADILYDARKITYDTCREFGLKVKRDKI